MLMGELDICNRPETITLEDEIVGVKVHYTEVGMNISTIIPCSMLEKVLMTLGEVDLGFGPSILPPIIHVIMVDHLVFIVIEITELGICITPASFLHINMAE